MRVPFLILSAGLCLLLPQHAFTQESETDDTTKVLREDSLTDSQQEERLATDVVARANMWLELLLHYGEFDAMHVGAFAQYQLTEWDKGVGSHGPVEARLTIAYLGPVTWQGEIAEWLQAAFQTYDENPTLVEYDLLVPASSTVKEFERVLYRVDRGELQGLDPTALLPGENPDPAQDLAPAGRETVTLFSGTYEASVFHGVGATGSDLSVYRVNRVRPFGILALGNGHEGLTFIGGGDDALPRFLPPDTRNR